MTLKFFENLSNNYLDLLDDEEDFNTIINVGEFPNIEVFRVHSAVLKYRSLYFHNELANANKDENNIKTINLRSVSIQQFEIIIEYIYGGTVSLENLDNFFIFSLILVAHEILLEELAKSLEIYLIETEESWLCLWFSYVFQESFQNDKLQALQKWCIDDVAKNPDKIFNAEDFTSIKENILIKLVIEWGIARNPGLPSDSKSWTPDNFQAMKITLQNCLPHIRYFQIPGVDVISKLKPYQQIFDENLWDDIIKRLISPDLPVSSIILPPRVILSLPSNVTAQFSTVITEAQAAEIASWVDSIDNKKFIYSAANNPYEFRLLLRGSRDGFTPESFWKLCNEQKNVVVVVKVEDIDEILGGYNPIGWSKPAKNHSFYKNCKDSFIFSLKTSDIQNSILSRVKFPEHAIRCSPENSPSFGDRVWGMDLAMHDNIWECRHMSYEKSISYIDGGFSAEEYEIFKLVKNPIFINCPK